jgi:hypothetical protein
LYAYGWMDFYFKCMGDYEPNTNGEIHLDYILVYEIYKEYAAEMIEIGRDMVSASEEESAKFVLDLNSFGTLWRECFPHVKIREYKAVTGKCDTCAKLSKARRQTRCKKTREYVTALFSLHRSLQMGERMAYAERVQEARARPSSILSFVTDGMAQLHCQLPWQGNLSQFGHCLPQHIQGVLMHNRNVFLYRTFHTVTLGANLQIHTFLLSLNYIKSVEGKCITIIIITVYYYYCCSMTFRCYTRNNLLSD